MTALLNPPQQAAACQDMITHVRERLTAVESLLTHSVLDRDKYMMTIGEAQSLQVLVENLQSIYRKNFET